MGKWIVEERNLRSRKRQTEWKFQSFSEAEEFYRKRSKFYQTIGLDCSRNLALPVREVTSEELTFLQEILENPNLYGAVKRHFKT